MSHPRCRLCYRPLRPGQRHYCSRDCYDAHAPHTGPAHIPTLHQIALRAGRVRLGWAPAEARKRLRHDWRDLPWRLPAYAGEVPEESPAAG
jgi:hypothetical protein